MGAERRRQAGDSAESGGGPPARATLARTALSAPLLSQRAFRQDCQHHLLPQRRRRERECCPVPWRWGRAGTAARPRTLPPLPLQPNANLLEICYKDRIQQFDDDEEEEEEGQGSGESDGEDSAWQGRQLARGTHLGPPASVR